MNASSSLDLVGIAFNDNVIRNSAQLAGEQLGVTVEFRNPSGGDLSEMGRLIDQAIASKPSGIISTVPDENIVEVLLRMRPHRESRRHRQFSIRGTGEKGTRRPARRKSGT